MQRTINVKPLLWLGGVLAVLALAVHLLHAHQVHRNASELSRQAQEAWEHGENARALTLWAHLLALEPDNLDVMIRYALARDALAATPTDRLTVWKMLNNIITRDPEQHEVRYRLIHRQIELGFYRDAIREIEALLPHWTQKPGELEHMLGWCCEATEDYERAERAFAEAIRKSPERIESYVLRAEVLRQRLHADEADRVMDEMIRANPAGAGARLARGRYHRQQARLDIAGHDLDQALRLAPPSSETRLDILLETAELAQLQRDLPRARLLLLDALPLSSAGAYIHHQLAHVEIGLGNRSAAMTW